MRLKERSLGMLLLAGAALSVSAGVVSAAPTPAEIIKTRQDDLKAMGGALKAIFDQLKSGMPDKAVVLDSAKKIDGYAADLPTWFPQGTGPEAGVKTAAKPEIWAQPAEFKTDAESLKTEADKLLQVAMAGDMAALGAQAQATGKACGTCHKTFRVKEEDH
jgi:cytochrome c556